MDIDQELTDAIEAWWSRSSDEAGEASVIRSWYLIAEGVGADEDGSTTHLSQVYDADIVQQLGLAVYMRASIDRRMWRDDGDE